MDSLDRNCRTPAMYAVALNSVSALRIIVEAGADLSMKDLDGNTLLHIAYMYSSTACIRYIRSLGVVDETITNINDKTPLEMAGKGKSLSNLLFYHQMNTR
jgi:ankyrin repeat protein